MFKVDLCSINGVKEFVNKTAAFVGDVTLTSGRYVVDGKSIMGIFSLDLSKPVDVEVTPAEKEAEFKASVENFLVK